MKVNLEILSGAYVLARQSAETPRLKELVPNMLMRRRLSKAAKISAELLANVGFTQGRIVCGSAYGELETTAHILNAIKDEQPISPSDFQNSVYNTAVSYLSILHQNHSEIMTLSCGELTALQVLKTGALKALDGDTLLLLCFETLNIEGIEQVNRCIDYLESAVALVVKATQKSATLHVKKSATKGVAPSISQMLYVAENYDSLHPCIVEVDV
jgi:hypothetical protein